MNGLNKNSPFHRIPHHSKMGWVNCFIEIPAGSRIKYEFNEDYDIFEVSRILPRKDRYPFGEIQFPMAYGCIPRTLSEDGDCLDVLIYGSKNIERGTLVEGKIIGALKVVDNGKLDYKMLVIPFFSPLFSSLNSLNDIGSAHEEITEFFKTYKNDLPSELRPEVGPWISGNEAEDIFVKSIHDYESMLMKTAFRRHSSKTSRKVPPIG